MKFTKFISAAFFALISVSSIASASVITFDDITYAKGDPAPIANGYSDLSWNNFWVARAGYSPQMMGGLVSGDNIGFMISADKISSFYSENTFTFNGVNIAKMFNSGWTMFEGYAGDKLVFAMDVYSVAGVSKAYTFDWVGVTRVDISVFDRSERVVFDNLIVSQSAVASPIPEPASISIFGAGMILLGAAASRKKANKASL